MSQFIAELAMVMPASVRVMTQPWCGISWWIKFSSTHLSSAQSAQAWSSSASARSKFPAKVWDSPTTAPDTCSIAMNSALVLVWKMSP